MKRPEIAPHQPDEHYRLLFECNPIPMWVFDRGTLRFLAVNDAAIKRYGFTQQEFLAMTILEIRPEEDVADALQVIANPADGLQEIGFWRHRKKNGELIDVEIVRHPLLFNGTESMLVSVYDVTARKRAEAASRQAEEKYRAMFEDSIVGIFQTTPDGRPLSINRAMAELHGYDSAEELIATVPNVAKQLFVNPGRLLELAQIVAEKGVVRGEEVELCRKDGTRKWVRVSLRASRDSRGNVVRHEGTAEDITEQKRAKQELVDSKNRYQALFEESGDANWLMDEDRVLDCNSAARQMFGYSVNAPLPLPYEMSPPHQSDGTPSRVAAKQKIASALLNGNERFEWLHQRKDGEVFPAEVCLTALTLSGRRVVLASVRDITERKQAEETLLFKTALLEAQIESTVDGFLVVDECDRVVLVNQQFGRHFDMPEELLNRRDDIALREYMLDRVEDPDTFLARIEYLNGNRTEKSSDELRLKNGKIFEQYSAPLFDAKGQYRGRIWYNRDVTERKQAELDLKGSEEKFRQLAENIGEVFWMMPATADKILYVSPAYEQIWGRTCESLYTEHMSWTETIHPDDRDAAVAAFKRQVQGEIIASEYRIVTPEMQVKWIRDRAFPVRDQVGKIIRIVGIAADITSTRDYESKLESANRSLLKSEARYRKLVEFSPEAIIVGQNGSIQLANEAAVKLFGVASAEALIGRQLVDFVCPEDFATIEETVENLYAVESRPRRLQFSIRKGDGSIADLDITCSSLIAEDGSVITQGVFRDITLRKQREVRQAQLIRGIEQVAESIVITDVRGSIIYVNPAFERITGYSRAEAIGSNPRILKSGQHPASFYRAMWKTLRAGETWSGDLINKRKDGSIFNEVATISPIKDEAGTVISYVAVKRDVTQELSLRRQLGQAQKMEAVGQLTGGIAHDFNNLLGVVIGNIELLEPLMSENAAALQRLQAARQAAHRGADLTRRLLAFSRSVELNPTPADLHKSIRSVVQLARALGPDVRIATQFDDSIAMVMVDAAGLESALLNLAVNARDAMPNGGALTISTQIRNLQQDYLPVSSGELKGGTYALISVSDTGCGMSRETLERAFEPFFTTKPAGKGTGLGLAMVYGFVKQSGGAVQISSEPGRGTTVTFCLQLAEPVPIPAVAAVIAADKPAQLSGKVLLVDDEPGLLEIAAFHLQSMGFTVYEAEDGASAIEAAKLHNDIDLLITDIIMPGGMNGVELAEQIRRSLPQIRVVYTSGFPAQAMTDRGLPQLDCPLLRKPYRRADLETAIGIALK
jgi:PAS domain S-box-containing protein